LNVRINSEDLADHPEVQKILSEGEELVQQGRAARDQIVELVHKKMKD
jgi:formiminotetrahydrofolate cyclodeaminase